MNAGTYPTTRRRFWLALVVFVTMIAASWSPAFAHEDHKKQAAAARQASQAGSAGATASGKQPSPGHDQMAGAMEGMGGMDMATDRSKMPVFERMLGWFGRLHPMVVHFPIAFFPAALFTAIVGRRRPAFAAPVQFMVVAGGIFAPIAAAAGWMAGMSGDPEPILAYHRWLGVGIGVVGTALAVWAWKRPWEDRGAGMILALTVITIAIAVQGFLGAGLTHGMAHLMF